MKLGVSTATLFGKVYSVEAVKTLSQLNIETCEIFLETFSEYKKEFASTLKAVAGKLQVHSVHTLCTNFEPQLFSGYKPARNDAFDIYRDVLESASVLGAKNYTFHGRTRMNRSGYKENLAQYISTFNDMTKLARNYGVNVCLENVEWCMYYYAGLFGAIKDACPDLKTCLDIKQARRSGYDYHDYLTEMSGRLNTVHVSDYDENGKVVLPGKGKFDFEKLIAELYENNFDGSVLIEVYDESFKTLDELVDSLDYIKNFIERG